MNQRSERQYGSFDRYAPSGDPRNARPAYEDDELSEIRRTPPVQYPYSESDRDVDLDRPAGVPRRRIRSVVWRLIGAVVIGGAFYGITQIAIHPEARYAITQWATLGHAEKVQTLERGVQKGIDWARTR